jgi:hypothetical protein
MIQSCAELSEASERPASSGDTLGRGAMVAQRTLDPLILVRIRAPQLDNL